MNNIEERLWNYIDGDCTPAEQQAVAQLIAEDEVCRRQYNELLLLSKEFSTMEMDEPSMAFSYNVMETIRTEQAMKPLKSAINQRIIKGISAFFILSISILVIITLGSVNWHTPDAGIVMPEMNVKEVSGFFTAPVVKGFLFFDVVMGLFILDTYLRRNKVVKG